MIFHHARNEANVTSPDHRWRNPNDPEASLFSRLDMMENYRLIDGRLCLYTSYLDSSDGKWYKYISWTSHDPYTTSIPSAGYGNAITHVKLFSCTSIK